MALSFPRNVKSRSGNRDGIPYGKGEVLPTTGELSVKGVFTNSNIYGQLSYTQESGKSGGVGLSKSGTTVSAKLGTTAMIWILHDEESSEDSVTITFNNETLATIPKGKGAKINFALPNEVFEGSLNYVCNQSDWTQITMEVAGDFAEMATSDFDVSVE